MTCFLALLYTLMVHVDARAGEFMTDEKLFGQIAMMSFIAAPFVFDAVVGLAIIYMAFR